MNSIKENREQRPTTIDYIVYRDAIADNRWVIKRLVVALIVAIALLFVSNMAWLYAWNQFDYSSTETTLESDGNSVANYTGGDGGVVYGGESNGTENDPNQANSNNDIGNTQNANP